ncbi:MAG: transglycosylase SLT domain-containing protein [bacterium]|nr:transglycosylase SLT domain-containing protein [bacterium]
MISTVYDNIIKKESSMIGLPFEIVKAVIKKESNFDPYCELGGAVGLMQITLAAAKEVGYKGSLKALYHPATNIKYGTKYLSSQIHFWADAPTEDDRISLGIAAYNLGQGRIRKASLLAKQDGFPHLKWSFVRKYLPKLIGESKQLSRRRINITLNYVALVKTYAAQFSQSHDNMMTFADSAFIK